MADRYDDRCRGREHERGMFDRASDEVGSWFGDDEAERRRRQDQRSGYREMPERGHGGERWSRPQPYDSLDEGRAQYDRLKPDTTYWKSG